MLKTRFQRNIPQNHPNTQSGMLMHNTDVSFWKFGTLVPYFFRYRTLLSVYHCLSGNRISVPSTDAKPGQREATLPADEEFRRKQRNKAVLDTQEVGKCKKNRCARMTNVISTRFYPVCDLRFSVHDHAVSDLRSREGLWVEGGVVQLAPLQD